jgi:hypothetical protein
MLPIVWYEVVTVSNEFLELLEDIPEAITHSGVYIGDKYIEGPKTIFIAESMEEIEENLPTVISELVDPKNMNVQIVKGTTNCTGCIKEKNKNPAKPIVPCSHGDIPIIYSRYEVDINKYLTTETTA